MRLNSREKDDMIGKPQGLDAEKLINEVKNLGGGIIARHPKKDLRGPAKPEMARGDPTQKLIASLQRCGMHQEEPWRQKRKKLEKPRENVEAIVTLSELRGNSHEGKAMDSQPKGNWNTTSSGKKIKCDGRGPRGPVCKRTGRTQRNKRRLFMQTLKRLSQGLNPLFPLFSKEEDK